MSSCCAGKKCFHCNSPLPAEPIAVDTGKQKVNVCSEGCARTVAGIISAGLDDFYNHRDITSVAERPQKPVKDWLTYERPAVMDKFVRRHSNGDLTADLLVQGVHCAACTWLIENTLSRINGIRSVEVNPLTTRAEIRWDPTRISLARVLQAIENVGYMPVPFTEQATQAAVAREKRVALRRLLVAGLGMMQVVSFAIAMYAGAFQGMDPGIQQFFRLISLLVATPVVLYSGAPFFLGALRNIKSGSLGMDVPVALAIGTAWTASVWNTFAGSGEVYFDSATMFVFFLSGTRYLEAAGRFQAFDLTHALAREIPSTTTRLTDAGSEEVGVMELQAGDTVLVATGSTFPADGTLLGEATQVDEALLTGESIPVRKLAGDVIVAGTVNCGDSARVRVDKTGPDTVLAQIGRLVGQAGNDKPRLVQITDRVASWFVMAVLLIAAGAGLAWAQIDPQRAFEIVLSVLVVTCPCALALATPAAFTVATGALARQGFLIRRSNALPTLAATDHVIFDKTGTLTSSAMEIRAVHVRGNSSTAEAFALAAALEANSSHPIARAFRSSSAVKPAAQVKIVPGCGMEGRIDAAQYRIGTLKFAGGLANTSTTGWESENPDIRNIYLGDNHGIVAHFEIVEQIRVGARELVADLQKMQLSTSIASGDQLNVVAALAKRIGIDSWKSGLLPEGKLELVRELQAEGETVTAIGDGINDSPVLAGADVSIAMGSGTSIAQHSADCVWLGSHLHGLDVAFRTARRTMQIVRQNLAWALFYNALAIPLAVTGKLDPWMAALGMSLSSLLVMLNALRLSRPTDSVHAAGREKIEPKPGRLKVAA